MLAAHGVTAIGLDDADVPCDAAEDAIEAFDTFEANAIAKARYFATLTGRICVADDSGLCIDALGGMPGVRSRRFALDVTHASRPNATTDQANNAAMLDACWDSGWAPPWVAHYACVVAYVHAATELVAHGRTDGNIVPDAQGHGGFGYDPYFVSADLGLTFAMASMGEKARVSHRGRAVAALMSHLEASGSTSSAR